MKRWLVVVVFLVLLSVLGTISANAIEYQVRYLSLPTGYSYGESQFINDNGEVAGIVGDQPVFWSANGSPTMISLPDNANQSLVRGINIKRQIAGTAYGSTVQPNGRGFVWSPTAGVTFMESPEGATWNSVEAINDSGLIVGLYGGADLPSGMSCIWNADTGALVSTQYGTYYDINNSNTICGTWFGTREQLGATWNLNGDITKLAPFGGMKYGDARSINNVGQVAGISADASGRAITLWNADGSSQEIPSPGGYYSFIMELNDAGHVLFLNGDSQLFGFLWSPSAGTVPSPTYSSSDMNNLGQILDYKLAVWMPVPEPSSAIVLFTGLAGTLGLYLRRRK